MNNYKEYDLLEEKFEYDEKAATQLAEATTELLELQRRVVYLEGIVRTNKKLQKYVWGTAEGKAIAFHDLETSHLTNILNYMPARGNEPPKELLAEARKRGISVGGTSGLSSVAAAISSKISDPFGYKKEMTMFGELSYQDDDSDDSDGLHRLT